MREVTVSSVRPAGRRALEMEIPEYLAYVGGYLDVAGKRNTDIACLPECFVDQGPHAEAAEEVPGPISTFAMDKAKQHGAEAEAGRIDFELAAVAVDPAQQPAVVQHGDLRRAG